MPDHGPQFDEFGAQSGSPHGGSYFDEGFGQVGEAMGSAHGKLFDKFPAPRAIDASHGEHWDEFPWQDIPTRHGTHFDDGFQMAQANGGPHATWFDAFRGGAHVRYMLDGCDYEGVVIHADQDTATVQSREGARHDVDYSQVMTFAPANAGQPSRAHRRGGMHKPETDTSVVAEHPSAPANGGGRHPVGGYPESPFANKTTSADDDVEKASTKGSPIPSKAPIHRKLEGAMFPAVHHGGFQCRGCGHMDYREHRVVAKGGLHPTLAFKGCVKCGLMHPATLGKTTPSDSDVTKDVDSTETSLQGEARQAENDAPVDAYCPRCEHVCRKAKNGRCPTCGGRVRQAKEEPARKTLDETLDVLKALV